MNNDWCWCWCWDPKHNYEIENTWCYKINIIFTSTDTCVSIVCYIAVMHRSTHVAASSRLRIVFPPIREYLRQAFCSRLSPWKGREGSQCAAQTLIPLAWTPQAGFPMHKSQYSPNLVCGRLAFIFYLHNLVAKYIEGVFSEVKAREPCIPFISVV